MQLLTLLIPCLLAVAWAKPQIPTPIEPPPTEPPAGPVPPTITPGDPGNEPPPSTILTPIVPSESGSPGDGPICQCGYTYCAAVLKAMQYPWPDERLAQAYCSTPNVACSEGNKPPTDVSSALFICLCDDEDDDVGTDLDLICGCDTCLILGPDYRGRCKTPCTSGICHSKSDEGGDDGGDEGGEEQGEDGGWSLRFLAK